MELMLKKEQDNIHWLEFELLADSPRLAHGVFLRHGGCSAAPFDSLNLSYSVGDEAGKVSENSRRALQALGTDAAPVRPQACHGATVALVDALGLSPSFPCDGLLTDLPRTPLLVTHADCQVALFFDPIKNILANVHCGWRGNVQNIYANAITLMKEKHGCRPENILACISPSLGPDHAEFIHYKTEFPPHFWDHQPQPLHFDLWSISEQQLLELGILPAHLEIARQCTYTNATDFFSYRKDRECGRNAVIAYLK